MNTDELLLLNKVYVTGNSSMPLIISTDILLKIESGYLKVEPVLLTARQIDKIEELNKKTRFGTYISCKISNTK